MAFSSDASLDGESPPTRSFLYAYGKYTTNINSCRRITKMCECDTSVSTEDCACARACVCVGARVRACVHVCQVIVSRPDNLVPALKTSTISTFEHSLVVLSKNRTISSTNWENQHYFETLSALTLKIRTSFNHCSKFEC